MNRAYRPASLFLSLGLSFFAGSALRAEPGHVFPPVTPAQIAGIDAALPKASFAPAKPRRVLVFYRTEGFVHPSIPVGIVALQRLGESTGAYTSVVSDDMALFDPKSLAGFDAIVFLNSTSLQFADPVHRQALLEFVRSGKGVVGIHAATDNFPTWPEGQALIGGVFHSHPWNAADLSAVKLDDPGHVLNRSFGGKGFWIRDEIYQIVGPYQRDRQRVLLSLDMSKPENARPAGKLARKDNDFPISWLRAEGQGRVFYTSLGHREDVYFAPAVLRHMFDGLRYALGDLSAADVPSAKLPDLQPALAPEDRTALQEQKTPESSNSGNPPGPIADTKPVPEENIPTARLSDEWRSLLDETLQDWELWMGVPHQSVTGLPPGTPTSPDAHKGTPLGLNNDPKKVFSVIKESGEDVLHITGEIFGGLTTREAFTDYHLQLQVRWGKKVWEPKLTAPRDSGLLFHCTGPHGVFWNVWMPSVEFQVEEKNMGDLYLLEGTNADVPVTKSAQGEAYDPKGELIRGKNTRHLVGDFEKPHGEWNTLDLYTLGQRAIFVVNGQVVQVIQNMVNKATPGRPETPLISGLIQIQSEGAEVDYRRIKIRSISELPPAITSATETPQFRDGWHGCAICFSWWLPR